jgi:hypothetical protein
MMSYALISNDTNEPLTANDSEVFQVVTLNSDTFVIPRRGGENSLSGKVNCSIPFSKQFGSANSSPKLILTDSFISLVASPDGRTCLAVGCDEGLWMGNRDYSQCEGLRLYHVLRLSVAQLTLLYHSFAPCIASEDGNAMCDARRVWDFPSPCK